MERLTADYTKTFIREAATLMSITKAKLHEHYNQLFDRLQAYEDKGLTPGEATQMQQENVELKELLRLAVEEMNKNCKACSGFNHSGGGCGMGVRRYTECRNDFFKHWQWQHADRARKVGVEV